MGRLRLAIMAVPFMGAGLVVLAPAPARGADSPAVVSTETAPPTLPTETAPPTPSEPQSRDGVSAVSESQSRDGVGAVVPDTRKFLEEVRQNLQSDESLLDQYTFTEVFKESRLDSRGAVQKTKTEVYEVYPSIVPRKIYRRLISRDGTPLTEAELAEQDRKQEEKTEKREQRIAEHDAAASESHAEENRRKERAVVDEIFRMDEIGVVGRETVDGRPTIIVSFTPRPGYKPVTEGGKTIQKLAGRAWIDEADRQLVRLEAKLVDSMGVGPAKLARLQKGATAFFQRKKVNDEVWLPAEAHFSGAAKALLLFGTRIDVHSTYGDYKKFSVSTEEDVSSGNGETSNSP